MRCAVDLLRLSHGSKPDGISGNIFVLFFFLSSFCFCCCWLLHIYVFIYLLLLGFNVHRDHIRPVMDRETGNRVPMSSSSHALRPADTVKTDCRHQNNIIILRWRGHRKCNKQLVDFTACFFNSCGEHRHNRMSPFIAMLLKWFNDFKKGRQVRTYKYRIGSPINLWDVFT